MPPTNSLKKEMRIALRPGASSLELTKLINAIRAMPQGTQRGRAFRDGLSEAIESKNLRALRRILPLESSLDLTAEVTEAAKNSWKSGYLLLNPIPIYDDLDDVTLENAYDIGHSAAADHRQLEPAARRECTRDFLERTLWDRRQPRRKVLSFLAELGLDLDAKELIEEIRQERGAP